MIAPLPQRQLLRAALVLVDDGGEDEAEGEGREEVESEHARREHVVAGHQLRLGDEEAVKAAMDAVANQGKAK